MTKKKKIISCAFLIFVFIGGLFGFREYQKLRLEYHFIAFNVYRWVETDQYGYQDPLPWNTNLIKLKINPPKVKMGGRNGLYINAMAYESYSGKLIDYEDLKAMMERGEFFGVNKKYADYINWFTEEDTSGRYVTGYGKDYRDDYASVFFLVGAHYGILSVHDGNYEDYVKVIEMDRSSGNNYIEKLMQVDATIPW